MYNTGEAYRQAIQADVRDFRIKGTLTSREGDVVEFDDTDVVSGSYTHNASSQPGDLFQHGGAVAKDMSIKILDRDYIIDNSTGDEWGRNYLLDSKGTIDLTTLTWETFEYNTWEEIGE